MIHSLGHSTLSQEDFVAACHTAGLQCIIDVRSHPGSNANPQYNSRTMSHWLATAGIGYEWWPDLGGWADQHAPMAPAFVAHDVDVLAYCHGIFPKQRINRTRAAGGFSCYGFHDYQYFQTIPAYLRAVSNLVARQNEQLAMVCCEARFVLCHRAMISDHLGVLGVDVLHIEPRFRKIKLPRTVVKMTSHGKLLADRLSRYDNAVIETWRADHEME